MPRAAGQIDLRKNEAILDAAAVMLSERGFGAPIEAIARLAGVSKQTIYNQYGGKTELVRAMIARRTREMGAALQADPAGARPGATLAAFGLAMVRAALSENPRRMLRGLLLSEGGAAGALASQVYAAGPGATLAMLTDYLRRSAGSGALDITDPAQAARMFMGMMIAAYCPPPAHASGDLSSETIQPVAREVAGRFVKAYTPV